MQWMIYLLIGIFSGTLSGLLGIGGGIIVVPTLLFWFQYTHLYPDSVMMFLAAGTSLATMIGTTLSSASTYYHHRQVLWPAFLRFFPGLCVGIILGSLLTRVVSSCFLMKAFALFLIFVGAHVLSTQSITTEQKQKSIVNNCEASLSTATTMLMIVVSLFVGILSTLFGIGGGLLIVPFFLAIGMSMSQSSGTSAWCGIPISIVGTTFASMANLSEDTVANLPWGTIGHVYWPAALTITTSSTIFAHFGSKYALKTSPATRKIILSIILFLCAMNLLFFNNCHTI